MKSVLIGIMIIAWFSLFFIDANAFEAGNCVYNEQFQQHKKVTIVRTFVYEYCIFNKLKCEGNYTIRKKWFDKNHVKTECPSKELTDDLRMDNKIFLTQLSGNFTRDEFACKCCGKNKTKKELITKLQRLRDFINLPIYIESGYRCKKHNSNVGGVVNSQHLLGKAADIMVKKNNKWMSGRQIYRLVRKSQLFKNDGIGVYRYFVHLDIRGKHARWHVN